MSLPVDGAESEKVRWYLEDYAEFPADPARRSRAARRSCWRLPGGSCSSGCSVRGARRGCGRQADGGLAGVRVEIDADPSDVPGLPWELLRDPRTDRPVALAAAEFVRTHHQTAARAPARRRPRAAAGAAGDLPPRWRATTCRSVRWPPGWSAAAPTRWTGLD